MSSFARGEIFYKNSFRRLQSRFLKRMYWIAEDLHTLILCPTNDSRITKGLSKIQILSKPIRAYNLPRHEWVRRELAITRFT